MSFKASAPGSLMVLGEYAVLENYPALVAAIDKRMMVTLTPRTDDIVQLHSDLGHYQTNLKKLQPIKPFDFVLAVLEFFSQKLTTGCTIKIESEFSSTIGFASSAAVTVATFAAVLSWLDLPLEPLHLIQHVRSLVRQVQGMGSGADVSACVLGGLVAYTAEPLQVEKISHCMPLTVLYSGSKTKTVDAIQFVQQRFENHPEKLKKYHALIGDCSSKGIVAAKAKNWELLGDIMKEQQTIMDALGVNTPALQTLLTYLEDHPTIYGAKISGSGLGDCVIGIGNVEHEAKIPVSMTLEGVRCEKI